METPISKRFQPGNLFTELYAAAYSENELVESLIRRDGIQLERIISNRHTSPPDFWYDQESDEWVVLLTGKASIEFHDGSILHMGEGDHIFLPAGTRHRVSYTSKTPPCLWLALHMKASGLR